MNTILWWSFKFVFIWIGLMFIEWHLGFGILRTISIPWKLALRATNLSSYNKENFLRQVVFELVHFVLFVDLMIQVCKKWIYSFISKNRFHFFSYKLIKNSLLTAKTEINLNMSHIGFFIQKKEQGSSCTSLPEFAKIDTVNLNIESTMQTQIKNSEPGGSS